VVSAKPDRRDHDVDLATTFAEVARSLLDELGLDATLDRICCLAVQTVDGCQAAGISIAEGKRVTSRATTDDMPSLVDQLQTEMQEGPCVDAIREHQVFVTGSLSHEQRWPEFAPRAHERTGIESVLSLRLFPARTPWGR